jgi:uncharacterized protein YjbI with pentapeptide repeats
MANQEQLAILKQGVEVWNEWRKVNPDIEIVLQEVNLSGADIREVDFSMAKLNDVYFAGADLREADLSRASLKRANLRGVNMWMTNLDGADLRGADLFGAYLQQSFMARSDLREANLFGVNLKKAELSEADIRDADLFGANIVQANLQRTNLSGANLERAIFRETDLRDANLNGAILKEAGLTITDLRRTKLAQTDFTGCYFYSNVLDDIDLSTTIGLETIVHGGPSTLGMNTVQISKGRIATEFLRGCGLSDWEIEQVKLYNPELTNEEIIQTQYKIYDLRAEQALQLSPLFISYSRTDNAFVDKLEGHLNKIGVRFWRDVYHATAGKLEKQIDRAIRHNPTVLLILSKNSIKSDWVEHEVRTARVLEKELGRDTLCPVALDDSWKDNPWPKRVMEQVMEYNILDFSGWEDDVKFEGTFRRLIDGLELFYKG